MSTQKQRNPPIAKWATLRRTASIVIFFIIAATIEFLVVTYAISIGIRDQTPIQVGPLTFSLLFQLVPIAVILVLTLTWIYLTKSARQQSQAPIAKREKEETSVWNRAKMKLTHTRIMAGVAERLRPARTAIKTALTVLLAFAALILLVSLITYPRLVYESTSGAYEGVPAFLGFTKSVAQTFSPILSPIANALKGAAPAFGVLAVGVGNLFAPLALLDDTGKYLVFQCTAAWIPSLASLLYVAYLRRGYWFRKTRRL